MSKFTDAMNIHVHGGDGGSGAVSFRREKYIPYGGPDGGDGGNGGSVFIRAHASYTNLSHLFHDKIYKAGAGRPGMGKKRHGHNGEDLIINVPSGTQVCDYETGEMISDLLVEGDSVLITEGGVGGRGNAFFKSSTNRSPKFSQPGIPGSKKILSLNLKLIADVGLVGLPNAGKSTLLSKVTNAKPKIADYPFTTLTPNLGVVERGDASYYKIADIPGIIEGAHTGHGLGLSFLQHIERVKVILFLIDATEKDPAYNLHLLKSELNTYNKELTTRPSYILFTKVDLVDEKDLQKKIDQLDNNNNVLAISSIKEYNLNKLLDIIDNILEY